MSQRRVIVVHGGAGTIRKSEMSAEAEQLYKTALKEALNAGFTLLEQGEHALAAAEAAVAYLEDCPLFNAGRGSVFTFEGKHEMDAAVMRGDTLDAGAVAGVSNVKNPVRLASSVMKNSDHVLLCGAGAEAFAREQGIEFCPDEYFFSDFRYKQWQSVRNTDRVMLDHSADTEKKFGTVGAVAVDAFGNVAAATSTGGMTNKRYGRIGDSPLIGAGTYANNATCAVSCTGNGEYFIRAVAAYDVSCLMEYQGFSLKEACAKVVQEKLVHIGGEGGLIAVDGKGSVEMVFNSEGMYRGFKTSDGAFVTAIYKESI